MDKDASKEVFLPAPDYREVEATIIDLFDPARTVRYEEDSPMPSSNPLPKDLGRRGTKLFLIEQARTGLANVYELTGRQGVVL